MHCLVYIWGSESSAPLLSCSFTTQCPCCASGELICILPRGTGSFCPAPYRYCKIQAKRARKAPQDFILSAFKYFADQWVATKGGRKVIYLRWQLCLRESEGTKTQLLIMDVCPRYWRPKFRSQIRMLAPIRFHIGHESSVAMTCLWIWQVWMRVALSAPDPITCALLILLYFTSPPVCIFTGSFVHIFMIAWKFQSQSELCIDWWSSLCVPAVSLSYCVFLSDPFYAGLH